VAPGAGHWFGGGAVGGAPHGLGGAGLAGAAAGAGDPGGGVVGAPVGEAVSNDGDSCGGGAAMSIPHRTQKRLPVWLL
jgi:hypothetical protein